MTFSVPLESETAMKKLSCLSGTAIKLLAVLFMTIDHVGFYLGNTPLRYIGRLAFPLFAYMVAEGCRYTKNKRLHFALLFLSGAVCHLGYHIANPGSTYLNVFLTFSASTLLIYLLQYAKECSFKEEKNLFEIAVAWLSFGAGILAVYYLSLTYFFDYSFMGVILPVMVALPDGMGERTPAWLKRLDSKWVKLAVLSFGLWLLVLDISAVLPKMGGIQWHSFLVLIPLALYNGKSGKYKLKYFFYLYYPLHLAVLEGLYWLWFMLG